MRYEDASQSGTSNTENFAARDDSDALAAGARGPATGNVISGAETQSGTLGADLGADGARVVSISGAQGNDSSFSGGKLSVGGEFGRLTIDAQGNYSYLANKDAPESSRDVFTYKLAAANGQSDSAALTIEIGKSPAVVQANAQRVIVGPDGVVVLPAGVELSDVQVSGRNLLVTLPDGTQMLIIDGAVFVPRLVIGDVEVPATNLAALLIDSEIRPAAGVPQSGGGNFEVPVGPLDPGVDLGDLIPPTELTTSPPEFEEAAFDIDSEPSLVIQTPDQPAGVEDATASVNENALPARGLEPAGSNSASTAETTTGTIVYQSADTPNVIAIGGVAVTALGQTIAGTYGTITITSIADGAIGYSYTLGDNTLGDATQELFTVTITDRDGDVDTATLTISIVDDVPTPAADVDSVREDGPLVADGNVLTGSGGGDANATDGAADTPGADGIAISGIAFGATAGTVGAPLAGAHGSLVLGANGAYVYTLNNQSAAVQALGVNETLTETFTYTVTDGDGDVRSTTLTITINGTNDAPTVVAGAASVSEEGLAGGNPDAVGLPSDTSNSATTTGQLAIADLDGDALVVTLGVPAGSFTSHGQPVSWVLSSDGHVLTGTAGGATVVTVTVANTGAFSITLAGPLDHPNASAEDALALLVPVSVNDGVVTVASTLTVSVEDDSPTVSSAPVVGSAILIDESAGASPLSSGAPLVATSAAAMISTAVSFGGDGVGASTTYGLSLLGNGAVGSSVASGLQTALGDQPITLTLTSATLITATYNGGAQTAFTIQMNANGTITVTQFTALEHLVDGPSASDHDDSLDLVDGTLNLVNATATYRDFDGDSVSTSVAIGGAITFRDDGPTVTLLVNVPTDAAALAALQLTTGDDGTEGAGSTSDSTSAAFGGVFSLTSDGGADGTASSGIAYQLGLLVVQGADSGLDSNGASIFLYNVGGTIFGSTSASAPAGASDASVVFAISTSAAGVVTLTQYAQVDHATQPGANDAPFADQLAILGNGLVQLTATASILDNDGDSDSESSSLDLGNYVRFADDGPAISAALVEGATLRVDETDGVVTGAEVDLAGGDLGTVTVAASSLFTVTTDATSADAPTVTSYALDAAADGTASGLLLSTTDTAIVLVTVSATLVEGRVGTVSGALAFSVSIDAASGDVTLTQYLAVEHPTGGASHDEDSSGLAAGVLGVSVTATDFDNDTDVASVDLGSIIRFEDDGPAIDVTAGSDAAIQLATFDAATIGAASSVAMSTADFSGAFAIGSSAGGSDGVQSLTALSYTLATSGGASGLSSQGAQINLYLVGTTVVGSTSATALGVDASNTVFDVTVAADGVVTLTQYSQIDHPIADDPSASLTPFDDQVASLLDSAITLTASATITDNDGDTASDSASLDIGANLSFADDGPAISAALVEGATLRVDETDGVVTGAEVDLAGGDLGTVTVAASSLFTVTTDATSADAPTVTSYALDAAADGTASGLLLSTTDTAIVLVTVSATLVEGRVGTVSGALAFSVSIDAASGDVTLTQYLAVEHPTGGASHDEDSSGLAAGVLGVSVTATDFDNDTDVASVDLGSIIRFEDDGPAIDVTAGSDAAIQLATFDAATIGAASSVAMSTADFSGAFAIGSSTGGSDGVQSLTALSYTLATSGGASGLSSQGAQINLYLVGTTVVGSTSATALGVDASNTVFDVTVAADGVVTLTQYSQIDHPIADDPSASLTPFDDQVASLLDSAITLTASATITDNDGDTASDSASLDIGANLSFADDGPDVTLTLRSAATIRVDETDGVAANAFETDTLVDGHLGQAVMTASDLFVTSFAPGADGATDSFTLTAAADGTASGLLLSTTDTSIVLKTVSATVVEGRVGTVSGALAFTVSIDAATGAVTLTQYLAVEHPTGGASHDEDVGGLTAGVLSANRSAIDFDNDTDVATADLGSIIRFEDDGPAAVDDSATQTAENADVTIDVFTNDFRGADGAVVSSVQFVPGSQVGAGTLTNNGDGTFTLDPVSGQTGTVVFQYSFLDLDGDMAIGTATITLLDDSAPVAIDVIAKLDDDGLAGNNPASVLGDLDANLGEVGSGTSSEAVWTGTLGVSSGGADTPLAYSFAGMAGATGTVGTEAVLYSYDGTTNTLSATTTNGGRIGTVLFTAQITDTATGAYTVTLRDNILHDPVANGGDDTENDASVVLTYTVSDSDVPADSDSGTVTVTFDDDMPTARDNGPVVQATENVAFTIDALANDAFGADGVNLDDAGSVFVSTQATQGTVSYSTTTHLFTYTPNAGAGSSSTADSFSYTIIDADGDLSTATVTVTLQPDSAPVAIDVIAKLDDDGLAGNNPASVLGDLDANLGEVGSGTSSEAVWTGTLGVSSGGADTPLAYSFAGMAGATGTVGTEAVLYSYNGTTNTLSATTTNGGRIGTVLFTAQITDTATGAYTVTLRDNILHDPVANGGDDTENDASVVLTYTVSDSDVPADSDSGTVTVTFDDDMPTARDNGPVVQATENVAFTIDALANDAFGADGVNLDDAGSVFVSTQATQGTVSYSTTTHLFTYTPNAGAGSSSTADSFSYTIIDADGDLSTATVTVTLQPDSAPVAIDVIAKLDDDGLAGNNPASVLGDLDANLGEVGSGTSSEAVWTGTLGVSSGGADTPLAYSFAGMAGATGTVGTEAVLYSYNGTTNTLSATTTNGGRIGTVLFTAQITDTATGAYTVTLRDNILHDPVANGGDDTENDASVVLTYTVSDSDVPADSDSGTVTVTFDDDMPTARDNGPVVQATENVAFTIDALANDAFGADGVNLDDAGSVFVSTQATQGTVSYSTTTHLFTYTPNAGAGSSSTADSFSYTIIDADGDLSTATVTVTLQPDSAPVAIDVIAKLDDDGLAGNNPASVLGDLDANLGEVGSGTSSEAVWTGTLGVSSGGADTPLAYSFAGMAGATGTVGTEAVLYSYNGTTNTLSATTTNGGRIGTVLFTAQITDTATGAYTVTLRDNILHDPVANGGDDTENDASVVLTYTVSDSDVPADSDSGTVTVTFDDDMPTARDNGPVVQATENVAFTIDALANDAFGADGVNLDDAGSVFVSTQATQGTVSYSTTTHLFTYTPNAGAGSSSTADSFSYTIIDADGDLSTATVTVTLQPDSAPVAIDVIAKLDDDGLASGNALSTLGDENQNIGEVGSGTSSEAVWTGSLGVSAGTADAPISFSLAGMASAVGTTVGTETVTYAYNSVGGTGTLTATTVGGTRPGTLLFTVSLDEATGAYSLTLNNAIRHPTLNAATGDNTENNASVVLTYRATDSDTPGDFDDATITVDLDDDMPSSFIANSTSFTNSGSFDNLASPTSLNMAGKVGADGLGSLTFVDDNATDDFLRSSSGTIITSGGARIILSGYGTDTLVGRTETTNLLVVTMKVNPAGNNYTVDFDRALDDGSGVSLTNLGFATAGNKNFNYIDVAGTTEDLLFSGFNRSAGNVVSIGTVNTNNVAIGVNNQSMNDGDNLRVDFVNSPTVSGSASNTYDFPASPGHYLINNFSFEIVQVGGSTPVDGIEIWVRAYDADNVDPAGTNSLVHFNELADDPQVAITGIQVNGVSLNLALLATDGNGGYLVTGLDLNDRVTVGRTGGYDRLEIENAVSQTAAPNPSLNGDSFDVGKFTFTKINSGNPIEMNFDLALEDADGDRIVIENAITLNSTPAPVTPVALDTNHDGSIAYLGLDAGVGYDYDGDGSAEATAWVGGGDSLLVRDADGNGTVSGASEFVFGGNGATDLEALAAQYGEQLDASDADFVQFMLWNDANANGIADAGELQSLSDAGVVAIGLVSDGIAASAAGGDVLIAGEGSFTYVNDNGANSTGLLADVGFRTADRGSDVAQRLAGAANGAGVVTAAIAAMGLAASQVAANVQNAEPRGSEAAAQSGQAAGNAVDVTSAASEPAETPRSLLGNESRVAADDDRPSSSQASGENAPTEAGSVDPTHGSDAPTSLLDASEPAVDDSAATSPVAPMIVMPSADSLVAMADADAAGGSQRAITVEKVLAEALQGGTGGGDIDALLAGLGNHDSGENAALAALATPHGGGVSAWDMGGSDGLSAIMATNIVTDMAVFHHDAVQPAING